MSMYLPNPDLGPTGAEAGEFLEPDVPRPNPPPPLPVLPAPAPPDPGDAAPPDPA